MVIYLRKSTPWGNEGLKSDSDRNMDYEKKILGNIVLKINFKN